MKSKSRLKTVGNLATQVAGQKISTAVKGIFLSEEDRKNLHKKSREEVAHYIFNALSQLRGTALKLAQLFCGETGLLSDEYMRVFEQSHYRVPPLPMAAVRSALRQAYKEDPSYVFAEFDWTAKAAASLGQVHWARLKTGEEVAVKVQYPGIQQDVINDFKLARRILSPISNTGLIHQILNELEERIAFEVDYLMEIEHRNLFSNFQMPEGIFLPQFFPNLSRSNVLVMEYVKATHIDQWATEFHRTSQADLVSQKLFDLFLRQIFEWRTLHADPNFGNFMIDQNFGIFILDFGAVKQITPEDQSFFRLLWTTSPEDDLRLLISEYEKRGAILIEEDLDPVIRSYLRWIQKIIGTDHFDPASNNRLIHEGHHIFFSQLFHPRLQNFSASLTFVHRTFLGIMGIIYRLGGSLPTRQLLKKYF